jgi:hypothetical protein
LFQLLATSTVTLIALFWGVFTHVFRNMAPKLSLLANMILIALWIVSIVLLSRRIGSMVLSHTCDISTWQTDEGVLVCHIYKAKFAFMILSTFSIFALAVLDVRVLRQTTSRGAYREMKDAFSDKMPFARRGAAAGERSRTSSPAPPVYRRGGGSLELKDSPTMGSGDMSDGQRLIAHSPGPGYTPYNNTPDLS